jgi:alkanesulfonate monooxygenase SsuD/methylene tetrahydromethanopterin reductase-like flavin-dependent oxidoreductase (luciferase family)
VRQKLRFGFGFDLRNPARWQRPTPDLYAETLDFISGIEELGFGSVWLAEHHGIEDGYNPSPFVFGAAVAARTRSLRISSGVALAPFYHPVRLAEDLAVLDNISNGRVDFAPGLGYLPWEAEAYGFDLRDRGRITNEILEIVRSLWTGEAVSYAGEFFTIKNARCRPLPVQRPGIPIFVGGSGRPGLRRAARLGDGYIGTPLFWPQYLEEMQARGRSADDARIVSMDGANMWMVVSEDPERTLHAVAPHAHYQINMYSEWQEHDSVGFKPMDLETFKKAGALKVFTPEQAITYIRHQLELAPIEGFCMQIPAGYPLSLMAGHAELFARKVIPAFQ